MFETLKSIFVREKDEDITVKLKRKIFIYSVIEVVLAIMLLGFSFFLISLLLS